MTNSSASALNDLQRTVLGQLPDGQTAHLYTLGTASGLQVQISDYGARLIRVQFPDRHGVPGDLTLGHPTLDAYVNHPQARYFGAAIGRVANRIAHGRFSLDGTPFTLVCNDGPNALHGGPNGFHARLWDARPVLPSGGQGQAIELRLHSPDGDEGYPGALDVSVVYTLHDDALSIDYTATTDAPTLINLTNHAYWNLRDGGASSVLGHSLQLQADAYTPTDAALIPTGQEASVQGTPFDFTQPQLLGARIDEANVQLVQAQGYDHHFVVRGSGLRPVARLHDPVSGRSMEVSSDQPGLQVYSGNFIDGSLIGYDGAVYGPRSAVCLETQHPPDAPNHPDFPSIRLDPGQTFTSTSVFRFSVE
ncbi:galactose mutarotase (plasmid) [Deinococcus sp. KNUC1210]|uniref:aldose epimerase family protein n=1 Tax=Deinococcus sp. KNUC1210 TaxID=2917691 RepID=UPI001EEFA68D|nr:aldose epimerase family protein [Deinococcus sp. KNUC1210]ULH14278.1 galactose mutarotase [Deinococcus sp. KNUC1210]